MLKALDRTVAALAGIAAAVSAALILVMTALVGYGVVTRYLLGRPQVWVDELVSYLVVFVVMMGAAEGLRRGDHIAVDLVTERLGPRARRWVEVWGMAAVIAVSAVLIVRGWDMVAFARMIGIVSTGHLEAPLWIPQALVPLGFGLLLLAALNRLVRVLAGAEVAGTAHVP